jgi:hypothetical protein
MSFGKRTPGSPPPAPPTVQLQRSTDADGVLSVRTRVAGDGGIDKGFIALAAGVVVLSAGAAIAAPSVFGALNSGQVKSIAELVMGLDRGQMKAVLATEAFPDAEGRAFLAALKQNFPESHNRLLEGMVNIANTGGDRDDMVMGLTQWGMEFAPSNLEYIGRTGAEGFDSMLHVVTESLDVLRKTTGNCSMGSIKQLLENEDAVMNASRYGSDVYKVTMETNRSFVELAAKGRNAPRPVARLNADDENALQSVFISFVTDPQMMQLAQQATRAGNRADMEQTLEANLDICQIGRSIIVKLERLPAGTKSRILATVLNPDAINDALMNLGGVGGMGGFGGMSSFGPPPGLHPDVIRRMEEMQ